MQKGYYNLHILYIAVMVTLCFSSSLVSEVTKNDIFPWKYRHISIESGLVPET